MTALLQQIVRLNVGGTHFETTLSTLLSKKESIFAAMFDGRFNTQAQADGSYFIDRDASHFPHVLAFVRDGVLPFFISQPLQRELGFYFPGLAVSDLSTVLREIDDAETIAQAFETGGCQIVSQSEFLHDLDMNETTKQWINPMAFIMSAKRDWIFTTFASTFTIKVKMRAHIDSKKWKEAFSLMSLEVSLEKWSDENGWINFGVLEKENFNKRIPLWWSLRKIDAEKYPKTHASGADSFLFAIKPFLKQILINEWTRKQAESE